MVFIPNSFIEDSIEHFSKVKIEELVFVNKIICAQHLPIHDRDNHSVNLALLTNILEFVNSYHIDDKKTRIIKKAVYLLEGISYKHPFGDGNRRTAFYAFTEFLERNGFFLVISNDKDRNEFVNLLGKLSDEEINFYSEIELFILRSGRILEIKKEEEKWQEGLK